MRSFCWNRSAWLGDDEVSEEVWIVVDPARDLRFTAGLLNMADAARFLGIKKSTFNRWARLLDMKPARPRSASVTFVALVEAYVLWALRRTQASGRNGFAPRAAVAKAVRNRRSAARVMLGRAT